MASDKVIETLVGTATTVAYYTLAAIFSAIDACSAATTAIESSSSYHLFRDFVRSSMPLNYSGWKPWSRRDRMFLLHRFDINGTPIYDKQIGGAPYVYLVKGKEEEREEGFSDLLEYVKMTEHTTTLKRPWTFEEMAHMRRCYECAIEEVRQNASENTCDDSRIGEEDSHVLRRLSEAFEKVLEERAMPKFDDITSDEWEDVSEDVQGVDWAGHVKPPLAGSHVKFDTQHGNETN